MRHKIKLDEDHTVVLELSEFDEDVNLDKILLIDYANLEAEIVTFPVVLTRLGVLLADAENRLREREMALETWENREKKKQRDELRDDKVQQKYSVDDINYYMKLNIYGSPVYRKLKEAVSKAQRNRDIVNTFYWSAKDKSDKLNAMFQKMHPEQVVLENIGKSFNGIKIKVRESVIK